MPTFSVPAKRLDSTRLIASLSDDAVKELFAAIAERRPALYNPGLAEEVASKLKLTPAQDALQIIDTVMSMYPSLATSNQTVEAFTSGLAASTSAAGFSEIQVQRLKENLQKLLQIPSLSVSSKATGLLFECERTLVASRVITDIRPVFELDSTTIGASLITHTLKLEYLDAGSSNEKMFYVCIDEEDIDHLIADLERAKKKAHQLKSFLNASKVMLIE